jgi:hypothetical protein
VRDLAIPVPTRRPLGRIRRDLRRRSGAAKRGVDLLLTRYRRRSQAFTYQDRTYPYLSHPYNIAWRNERSVEVPIVQAIVQEAQRDGRRILEVGNTLSHYLSVTHDVVDLYERAPGVINADIVGYAAPAYDLIVSISTIEHIGYNSARSTVDPSYWRKDADTDPQEKLLDALAHLRTLLRPGGTAVVTMPLGYNPFLDRCLVEGTLPVDDLRFLLRTTVDNKWREADWPEVTGCQYGAPFPAANAVVIATIQA